MSLHLAPVSAAGRALRALPVPHPRMSADTIRPYIGILGVLIGSIASVLASRVTTFGLADLRGGLHAGFDEGAWITTALRHRPDGGRRLLALSRRHLRRSPRPAARHRAGVYDQSCSVPCPPTLTPS